MPLNAPPPKLTPLLRWPLVFLLVLVWAALALIAWVLGSLGSGARIGAGWALNLIEHLNS